MKTLTKEPPDFKASWKENDRVEVQVVSALGHAWAQAGHDVLHKSYTYGAPTLQEERILDIVNGIVLSGDLLLEQFHELVMKRTKDRWTHLSEFGSFLHDMDLLQSQDEKDRFAPEGLDIVFRFLSLTDQNYPLAVRNAIINMGFPDEPRLDDIIATFCPIFTPANSMLAAICLIHQMMPDANDDTTRNTAGAKECCSMISALTLLQNAIGDPEAANKFLRDKIDMTDSEMESLDFVLRDAHLQVYLDERHAKFQQNEKDIKPLIQSAWNWFRCQAKKPDFICGLFLRLAVMGATKTVNVDTLLSQLTIGSLSKSSTADMYEEDTTSSDTELE